MSITNSKSHMGFQLAQILVTSNNLEWHISPYFPLFHEIR